MRSLAAICMDAGELMKVDAQFDGSVPQGKRQ